MTARHFISTVVSATAAAAGYGADASEPAAAAWRASDEPLESSSCCAHYCHHWLLILHVSASSLAASVQKLPACCSHLGWLAMRHACGKQHHPMLSSLTTGVPSSIGGHAHYSGNLQSAEVQASGHAWDLCSALTSRYSSWHCSSC